jgi:acyl-CoA thioester hydrolase
MATMSQSMNDKENRIDTPASVSSKTPIRSSVMTVEPQWIDYNGHLNVTWYQLFFSRAIEDVYTLLGIGEDYYARTDFSMFALEFHISYLREIKEGDRVIVDSRILDHDAKRVHFFQTLIHADDGYVSATNESMQMHIDMAERRAAPFPAELMAKISAYAAAQAELPSPEQAGRRIGIRRAPGK